MQRMEQALNSASRRHIRYVYEHVTRTERTCAQQVFRNTAPSACPVQAWQISRHLAEQQTAVGQIPSKALCSLLDLRSCRPLSS